MKYKKRNKKFLKILSGIHSAQSLRMNNDQNQSMRDQENYMQVYKESAFSPPISLLHQIQNERHFFRKDEPLIQENPLSAKTSS